MKDVIFVSNDQSKSIFTPADLPHPGLFRLCGLNTHKIGFHQIILQEILDSEHALLIRVNYGPTGRFLVENLSYPVSGAIFSYKHPGFSKKKMKPGDVLSAPETYTLTWDALDLQEKPVTVNLTLIPLTARYGLQVHYTLTPIK